MRLQRNGVANKYLTSVFDYQVETPSWQVEYNKDSIVFNRDNGTTVIVEGEVYYYVDYNNKPVMFASGDNPCNLLERLYDSGGQRGFVERVEGAYNVAVVDKERDTVSVSGDAFNRVNLFYGEDGNCLVISTELNDVLSCVNKIEYDPMVLYCILILGYPPAKHTPYQGIRRLAIGQQLLLRDNKMHLVEATVKPLLSREMGSADLDQYGDILENAIISRTSKKENWVELSGWDSIIILGVLRKYFDTNNVHAVTLGTRCSDGGWAYVVKEAIGLGKHYDVPVEYVELDLADTALPKIWNDSIQTWLSHFIYEPPFGLETLANFIREKGSADATVYLGSFADALHDFAFSHFASLPYLSHDFHIYDGKMRTYLYSPTFLKKVFENTFEDDFIYKLLRGYHSNVEFVETSSMSRNELVFQYLLSFILSKSRLPFATIATESIFSNSGRTQFLNWLCDNYFKDAVDQIDYQNMYFWLIRLYQHFHLQGFEKNVHLGKAGQRVSLPYYDLLFTKFTQTMPEDWGRGLEWRSGKYPLKYYGCEKLGVPYELLESIYHLPAAGAESRRNIHYEMVHKSALTPAIFKEVRNNLDVPKIFDPRRFNINALNSMAQSGAYESIPALPLCLLMLLSSNLGEGC